MIRTNDLLLIIIIITIFSIKCNYIANDNYYILNNTAFCRSYSKEQRYFPLDLPERHIPWVWDAVYDPITSIIELTTMSRTPCHFNKRIWKEVLRLYPEYSNQLAYGLESNILVPTDDNITVDEELFLFGDRVLCEYLYNNKVVYSVPSLIIRGKRPWSVLGTTQIRCSTPIFSNMKWNSIKISLNPNRVVYTSNIFGNTSVDFPLCKLPNYNKNEKKYGLSVCTATARANRNFLAEWIEYHLVRGIEHFFIYNTAIVSESHLLNEALNDYINEGIVTVVPWHYANCVRNMACGRMAIYFVNDTKKFFQPPRAISQSTALASCYSRFKHTSKYITHIDDDEFLTFSTDEIYKLYHKKPKDLLDLSNIIFSTDKKIVAIKFSPIIFYPCIVSDNNEHIANVFQNQTNLTTLPRLGKWDQSEPGEEYEGKLIMKTEAVGMFFVHYLSMLENGIWKKNKKDPVITQLPDSTTAYYHYKYPYELSYNALEAFLPINNDSFFWTCRRLYDQVEYNRIYYPQIPYDDNVNMKTRYTKRMNIRL